MRHRLALALMSALTVGIAACGNGSSDSGSTQELAEGATFSFAITADPGKLDPGTAVLAVTNTALAFAYDTLVNVGQDGKIVSGLAEKWEVAPSSVKFTLRKGIICSDGSTLKPTEVAQNFTWVADPKNKSPLLGIFVPADTSATGDDAAGTVTVSTKTPFGFLLLSTANVFIVCGKGLADRSLLAKATSGTGAYTLTESVANDHYSFTVRPGYSWGPGGASTKDKGVPKTVVLKVVSNESTAANLMIAGELSAASFSGPDRARVKALPGARAQAVPASTGQFFYHQGAGRPTADAAVRQALTRGINLEELAKVVGENNGKKPTGLVTLPPCQGDSIGDNRPGMTAKRPKRALMVRAGRPAPLGYAAKMAKS